MLQRKGLRSSLQVHFLTHSEGLLGYRLIQIQDTRYMVLDNSSFEQLMMFNDVFQYRQMTNNCCSFDHFLPLSIYTIVFVLQ